MQAANARVRQAGHLGNAENHPMFAEDPTRVVPPRAETFQAVEPGSLNALSGAPAEGWSADPAIAAQQRREAANAIRARRGVPGGKMASDSTVWAAIAELQKEAADALLLKADDKAKLHSQKDEDTVRNIAMRDPSAQLTLAGERANAEGKDLVNILIKHAPEMHRRTERQLKGFLSHEGYGRTRALGSTRSDVQSDITRAFSR